MKVFINFNLKIIKGCLVRGNKKWEYKSHFFPFLIYDKYELNKNLFKYKSNPTYKLNFNPFKIGGIMIHLSHKII